MSRRLIKNIMMQPQAKRRDEGMIKTFDGSFRTELFWIQCMNLSLRCLLIFLSIAVFSTTGRAQVLIGPNLQISSSTDFESKADVAANPTSGEFLVVWYSAKCKILGQRIASDGTPVGSNFLVTPAVSINPSLGGTNPSIAYNSQMNEFLVAYDRNYGGSINNGIFAQRVGADGSLLGEEILIYQGTSWYDPSIAYDSNSNRYLVVWDHGSGFIRGVILDHEGTTTGVPFNPSTPGGCNYPQVVFDSSTNQYLVVFTCFAGIFGNFVDPDGILVGSSFPIVSSTGVFPSITWNATTNQYFIVWIDNRNFQVSGYNVFGGLLDVDGRPVGDDIQISGYAFGAKVGYSPATNRFFVTWYDWSVPPKFLHGRLFDADLTPHGNTFQISESGIEYLFAVGIDPITETALTVWAESQNGNNWDIFGQVIDVSSQTADISVDISDAPDPVKTEQQLTYTVTLTNYGPGFGVDVTLHDNLPARTIFVSAIPSQGNCNQADGLVTCDLGTIAAGNTSTVAITVEVPADPITLITTVTVSSTSIDPDMTNNSAEESTTVIPYPILTLLEPNGGEVVPSGSTYTIRWGVPAGAVRFKLFYSTDKGVSWMPITKTGKVTGTGYQWQVPAQAKNRNRCLVKVIGYDSYGLKVGADKSDAPFTIEVIKLTYPNLPEIFVSGGKITITWTINTTKKPVAKTILFYTKDAGLTWNQIKSFNGDPNPRSFEWTVPMVKNTKPNSKIKVMLKDANGNNLGSDVSDEYFTISPP